MNEYYVYMMASESGTLYVGMTNNLKRRTYEHKIGLVDGFTKKYGCHKLIYYESGNEIEYMILREKQIKNWNRKKKENLIKLFNPIWKDLGKEI
ncbi:MAG TPA: GIY-YIG nuclease family protein [Candidatus Absconditabacterales bacterium]|nr:GIY-YIG nuclease family protein [Candidatus Absconditabacterales bacterium]